MTELNIRTAASADARLLVEMIRELARVEEFPFGVTVTEEQLHQSLFGPRPAAEALIAVHEGQPVGFAVFYETFATTTGRRGLHLDDLFIRPEFQRRGFGLHLLRHVAAIAAQRSCGRFEWWALRTNVNAIRFYIANGARPMEELLIFRAEGESLQRLSDGAHHQR